MDYLSLFFIFLALELFEANWQKADTMKSVLLNNYSIYNKSLILYFILNPTFFYTLFLSTYLNNYSFLMMAIVFFKFLEVAFKLNIMKKLNDGFTIDDIMPFDVKMTFMYRYMNAIVYPLSFLLFIK